MTMFCTFLISYCCDLAPGEVHCQHTVPRSYCETVSVCVQHVLVCVLHTVDRDKRSDTRRLPSSASDACVWPACGHEAVFAIALVRAGGVHTASVLARTDASSWFCTLIDVYTAGAGVVQPKACVTFTHGAQVGADTAAICTAAFVRILL